MVLPPPGYSIPEIIEVIGWAKTLVVAFHDNYENSPARVQELASTIQFVKERLETFEKVSASSGPKFPVESIGKTLLRCDAFLEKYSAIQSNRDSDGTSLGLWIRRIWQTGRFAFDSRAERLTHDLQFGLVKLMSIYAELNVTKDINVDVLSTTQNNPNAGISSKLSPFTTCNEKDLVPSEALKFQKAVQNLRAVAYAYKREWNKELVDKKAADFVKVEKSFVDCWRELFKILDISEDLIPQVDPQDVLERRAQTRNRAVMELVTPSYREPMSFKRRKSFDYDEEGEEFIATIDLSEVRRKQPDLKLGDYDVKFLKGRRVIVWKILGSDDTLQHIIPREVHPLVLHTETAQAGREFERLQVHFREGDHQIISKQNGIVESYRPRNLTYTFTKPTYQDYFLSDVKGKTVQRFDTRAIWSEQTRYHHLSNRQVFFVWLDRENNVLNHRISFQYSVKEPQRFLEFRACWFKPPSERPGHRDTLELHFAQKEYPSPKMRKVTFPMMYRRNSKDVEPIPPVQAMLTPPNTGLGVSPMEYAPSDIVSTYDWLTIRFMNPESMLKCKTLLENSRQPFNYPQLPSPMISAGSLAFKPGEFGSIGGPSSVNESEGEAGPS